MLGVLVSIQLHIKISEFVVHYEESPNIRQSCDNTYMGNGDSAPNKDAPYKLQDLMSVSGCVDGTLSGP